MAVTRRKENKPGSQANQIRVAQVQYSYQAPSELKSAARPSGSSKSASPVGARALFAYDAKLIVNDLVKTVVITGFILVVLIVITWYLKR